jgi:hypothetical protein
MGKARAAGRGCPAPSCKRQDRAKLRRKHVGHSKVGTTHAVCAYLEVVQVGEQLGDGGCCLSPGCQVVVVQGLDTLVQVEQAGGECCWWRRFLSNALQAMAEASTMNARYRRLNTCANPPQRPNTRCTADERRTRRSPVRARLAPHGLQACRIGVHAVVWMDPARQPAVPEAPAAAAAAAAAAAPAAVEQGAVPVLRPPRWFAAAAPLHALLVASQAADAAAPAPGPPGKGWARGRL